MDKLTNQRIFSNEKLNKKMKLLFTILITLFIGIFANEGCSLSLKNTDCPNQLVCAKILLGTTPAEKAKRQYYYQCLPQQLIAQASNFLFIFVF